MQEKIAGTIMCIIGLVVSVKPIWIWEITESWKTKDGKEPSQRYLKVLRIVGGATIGVGFLLVTGILK
ncbi:MAG: hypothetical protein PUB54_00635 [Lachnospiraceae bacterium]|nr:hypothetical protein [Lachnospiraceae bacterium]